MTQGFTDSLQRDRQIVVAVDEGARTVRLRGEAEACTDLSCSGETLVVCDEGVGADLGALNPGDVVRIEDDAGRPRRIVVVRRAWDEIGSPEW